MTDTRKRGNGVVDRIRQERDRVAPAPALNQAVKGRREEFGAGRRCDTMSGGKGAGFEAGAGYHQGRRFTPAQHARNCRDGGRRHGRWWGYRKASGPHSAIIP
jgi:hypothetical protein